MTDQQINQAIAKVCGWHAKEETNGEPWLWMRTKADLTVESSMEPPNYCADLNAMNDAESMLRRKGAEFSQILLELVSDAAGLGVQYAHGSFVHVHAPARLRAEAFLRTLGKWEEWK